MKRVLVTRPLPDVCLQRLAEVADVTLLPGDLPRDEAELLRALPGHDVAVVQLTEPITDAVLAAAAPRLRLIAQVAVGLDNVDLDAAARRGVAVSHTPGVLTDATADLAMALLLAASRRVVEGDRYVREGRWTHWSLHLLTGLELRGAVLGVVGLGRIGAAVARRARAFGMAIQYTGRRRAGPSLEAELEARFLPLDALLATSDAVSLHVPLTPATHHLLGADQLGSMKVGSVLVNTARGSVVDEVALVAALRDGPLRAAGLDVFEDEPRVHPGLLAAPNAVLLPHLGSATDATRLAMATLATDSAVAALTGAPVPNRAQ